MRAGGRRWRSRRFGIELRRFAGPATYRDQIAHLRIAHLTDQHVGRITPVEVQLAAVEMTNEEKPDLVLLTGDFVCHSQLYLDQLTQVMRAFKAPVIAVLGNHDHWSGADEVRRALERGGVEVLCNRHTTITLRHERLQVVGLDDAYTGHARRDDAVKGLRPDLPCIGLSHIAEEADGLWRHGVPLVLSGHTHAGQVTLARLHEFAVGKIGGHRYVHGLYGSRRLAGERGRARARGRGLRRAPASAPRWCRSASAIAASARSRCSSSAASRATSSSITPSRSRSRGASRRSGRSRSAPRRCCASAFAANACSDSGPLTGSSSRAAGRSSLFDLTRWPC